MKLALIASEKQQKTKEYEIIFKTLEARKVNVNRDYEQVNNSKLDAKKNYSLIQEILFRNELFILEFSDTNFEIALIIGKILEMKKPLLLLTNTKTDLGKIIEAFESYYRFYLNRYSTPDALTTFVGEFIDQAEKLLNSKFLFNISPDMKEYLEWASEKKNTARVEIIRDLLNSSMLEDKDWKKYKHSADKA